MLLQYPDDLLFRITALLHAPSSRLDYERTPVSNGRVFRGQVSARDGFAWDSIHRHLKTLTILILNKLSFHDLTFFQSQRHEFLRFPEPFVSHSRWERAFLLRGLSERVDLWGYFCREFVSYVLREESPVYLLKFVLRDLPLDRLCAC
jgi:hypothetical protein